MNYSLDEFLRLPRKEKEKYWNRLNKLFSIKTIKSEIQKAEIFEARAYKKEQESIKHGR